MDWPPAATATSPPTARPLRLALTPRPLPPRPETPGETEADPDAIEEIKVDVTEIETEALRLELDEIQRMREAGTLGRETARELREEVYLLQMTVGD